MFTDEIIRAIRYCVTNNKRITFLVGAGISAESGIPTFRGKDGYWVSGSKNYKAEAIGTNYMYKKEPQEVWKWYLYRKSITEAAKPNTGHFMLKKIEDLLGNNFSLISQNVDSLNRKAGNSEDRTFLIHGDFDFVRCGAECSKELYPFPEQINLVDRNKDVITDTEWEILKCPKCGENLRPHVLWFDEYYDEEYYHYDTTLQIARFTEILFILGTSGATSLPRLISDEVMIKNKIIVDVNIEHSDFSKIISRYQNGHVIKTRSSVFLSELYEILNQEYARNK